MYARVFVGCVPTRQVMRRSFKNLEDPTLHSDCPPGSELNPGPENRRADCGRGSSLRPGRALQADFCQWVGREPRSPPARALSAQPRLDRRVGAGPSCRAALRRTGAAAPAARRRRRPARCPSWRRRAETSPRRAR